MLPGGWEGILYDTMYEIRPISECRRPWVSGFPCVCEDCVDIAQDSQNAVFDQCAFPYLSMIPLITAALILLTYSLRLFETYRPTWTKPFLREFKIESNEVHHRSRYRTAWSTWGLLAIVSAGLAQQIAGTIIGLPVITATQFIFPVISWVRSSFVRKG